MPQSVGFHEDEKLLKPETMERHRAIVSIGEELEAIDWYDQRVDASQNSDLKGILAHNRDEEKEHAAMTLEWLRRHDAKWNEVLRTYLFTGGSILKVEAAPEAGDSGGSAGSSAPSDGSLGIGSLKR